MRHEIKWSILLSLRVQIHLLSSVEFLRRVVCRHIGVSRGLQDAFVVVVDDQFRVVHAAVTDPDGVQLKIFPSLWSLGK